MRAKVKRARLVKLDAVQVDRVVQETWKALEAHITIGTEPYSAIAPVIVLDDVVRDVADAFSNIAPSVKRYAEIVGGVSARSWNAIAEKRFVSRGFAILPSGRRLVWAMPKVIYENSEVPLDAYMRDRFENASQDHWKRFGSALEIIDDTPPPQKAPRSPGPRLGRAEAPSARPQKGHSMQRTPQGTSRDNVSRRHLDTTSVGERTLSEVFGIDAFDSDDVDQRLWDFLRANDVAIETREPEGGDDLEWLMPQKITKEDMVDRADSAFKAGTYGLDELVGKPVSFGAVADTKLRDVIGVGRQPTTEIYKRLWAYIGAKHLLI